MPPRPTTPPAAGPHPIEEAMLDAVSGGVGSGVRVLGHADGGGVPDLATTLDIGQQIVPEDLPDRPDPAEPLDGSL